MATGDGPFAVRVPAAHDLDAYVACIEAGFSVRVSPTERERLLTGVQAGNALVAFDGEELVGTLAVYPVEHTLPGPVVAPALAVREVTVLPTHRRRGVLSALIRRLLEGAHERGDQLVVLFASEGTIYGRFGFGPASWACRYVVDKREGRLARPIEDLASGSVRLLQPGQAREAFPLVFDAARRRRAGEVDRVADWWDEVFEETRDEPGVHRFHACYEQDGQIDGYVLYDVPEPRGDDGRDLVLVELVAVTPAAYAALWAFLLGVDLTARVRTNARPVDEPARWLLEDPRALRTATREDHTWVRLVDVPGALAARRYAAPGRLVLELEDARCAWNTGRYSVEVAADGCAEVRPSALPADLALDVATLGATFLGGTSFATLTTAGRAVEHVPGAALRADVMWASDPPPFCTADF